MSHGTWSALGYDGAKYTTVLDEREARASRMELAGPRRRRASSVSLSPHNKDTERSLSDVFATRKALHGDMIWAHMDSIRPAEMHTAQELGTGLRNRAAKPLARRKTPLTSFACVFSASFGSRMFSMEYPTPALAECSPRPLSVASLGS